MQTHLSQYERETIINFNEGEQMASIFTYNKFWQRHLEKRLGLKPVFDNGCGAREYEILKKRIRPPRAPIKLSAQARAKRSEKMRELHRNGHFGSKTLIAIRKSARQKRNEGKTIKGVRGGERGSK